MAVEIDVTREEAVFLLCGLALETVLVAGVVRALFRARRAVREKLLLFCRRLSNAMLFRHPRTAEEKLIAAGTVQIRLGMARSFMKMLSVLGTGTVFTVQMNILRQIPRNLSDAFFWLVFTSALLATLLSAFPQVMTTFNVNAIYIGGMLINAVALSSLVTILEMNVMVSLVTLAIWRLPSVTFATSPWLVAAMNAVIVIQNIIRASLEDNYITPWANTTVSIYVEMMNFVALTALAFFLHVALKRNMEQQMFAGKASDELKAARELLRLTCDAVFELDENLCFAAHSPALAAMLLRTRPGYSLEGVCFTDLIASPEEAARAAEILNTSLHTGDIEGGEESSANAFHTRLTDSCSSTFRTEVFRVRLRELDGRLRHLIGLRDFTDDKALAVGAVDAQHDSVSNAGGVGHLPPIPAVGHSLQPPPGRRSLRGSADASGHGGNDDSKWQDAYLELDLKAETVASASLPVEGMEGLSFDEVFHEEGVEVMRQVRGDLKELDKKGDLVGKSIRIGDLHIRRPKSPSLQIWANVEVLRIRGGDMRLLLTFKVPIPKRVSRSSRQRKEQRPPPVLRSKNTRQEIVSV